jgi:hypothetical protein
MKRKVLLPVPVVRNRCTRTLFPSDPDSSSTERMDALELKRISKPVRSSAGTKTNSRTKATNRANGAWTLVRKPPLTRAAVERVDLFLSVAR